MTEKHRIEFLVRRDGIAAAQAWVERTLQLYREAVGSPGHASTNEYRRLFEQSIRDFEAWLKGDERSQSHPGDEVSVR
jgi:hypothetical protein